MTRMTPREWRSLIALLASIAGAIALTFFSGALVWILVWGAPWGDGTQGQRLDWLGWALMIALGGSLLVLVTLGMAINRRVVKFGRDGFEASGGDEPPAATVTTTTEVSAP